MAVPDGHWSSFQSLFQLSVALNIGFSGLLTIFGNTSEREKLQIDRLVTTARSYRDECISHGSNEEDGRTCYIDALNLQSQFHSTHDSWTLASSLALRTVCLVCAVISFLLLTWSSYFSDESIHWTFAFISWSLLLPIIWYIASSAWQAWRLKSKFSGPRLLLEKKVLDGLLQTSGTS